MCATFSLFLSFYFSLSMRSMHYYRLHPLSMHRLFCLATATKPSFPFSFFLAFSSIFHSHLLWSSSPLLLLSLFVFLSLSVAYPKCCPRTVKWTIFGLLGTRPRRRRGRQTQARYVPPSQENVFNGWDKIHISHETTFTCPMNGRQTIK